MTDELYTLEADAARLAIAIHCVKECDSRSFASSGYPLGDGWVEKNKVINILQTEKGAIEKKIRSLTREALA